MDNQFNMKKYFSETNLTYLTGAYTRLWKDWHYENITPGYDKFYFVEDGEFALIVNGTYREIRKNQLVLLPCNSTQTYYHFSDALATKYWVHFTMPYRDRDLLELLELPVVITVDDPAEVTELFRTILGQDQESTLSAPLIQKAALCRLFAYFVDHTQMPDTKEMLSNEKLAEVLAYIDKHLCEPLTVRRLGEVMHLHPNYFIRYFKRTPACRRCVISKICASSARSSFCKPRICRSRTSPRSSGSPRRTISRGCSSSAPGSPRRSIA